MQNIRAYHHPTNTWRFACLGQDGTYCRVDPDHALGETLEEFDCYEATDFIKTENGKESFIIGKKLNLPKVLS